LGVGNRSIYVGCEYGGPKGKKKARGGGLAPGGKGVTHRGEVVEGLGSGFPDQSQGSIDLNSLWKRAPANKKKTYNESSIRVEKKEKNLGKEGEGKKYTSLVGQKR